MDDSLYWVCVETDLSNQDLYLPPDTPVGKVNPKRLYKIFKHRHARQKQRLIKQQVEELNQFQKDFINEYKKELNVKPKIIACESIKGSVFLESQQKEINSFLSSISTNIGKVENINKVDERKNNEQLGIILKRHRAKFDTLEKTHQLQYEELEKIQNLDLSLIPKDISNPVTPAITRGKRVRFKSTSPALSLSSPVSHDQVDISSPNIMDLIKSTMGDIKKLRGSGGGGKPPVNNKRTREESDNLKRRRDEKSYNKRRREPIAVETSQQQQPNNNRHPAASGSSSRGPPTKKGSPTTKSAHHPPSPSYTNVNKPPPIVGIPIAIGPPKVTSATASTAIPPSTNRRKRQRQNQQTPLFVNANITTTQIETLMDRGSLLIKSKPNRVIIRGPNGTSTVYGNPKDYDDAMNSSKERNNNPVYKRHMNGQDYLFYKTESGHVVTIGPVSKVQPLIHKFFLSM